MVLSVHTPDALTIIAAARMSDDSVSYFVNRSSRAGSSTVDVLSEAIGLLGLEGTLYCRSELSAPWSLALPPAALAHFHVLDRGTAWLHLDGGSDPIALAPGDLVVL